MVKYFTEEDFFQLDESSTGNFGQGEQQQRNQTFSYRDRSSTLMGKNDQSADARPKEVLLTKNMQTQIIERLNEKLDSMKLQYE